MKNTKLSFDGVVVIAALTMSVTNAVGDFTITDPNHPNYDWTGLTMLEASELCPGSGLACAENKDQTILIEWDGITAKF